MSDHGPGELTSRELQCLRGVFEHKRSKVIAEELGLSPKTVDTYIASATKKLGATDRDTAVRVILQRYPELWGQSPSAISDLPVERLPPAVEISRRHSWPFPTVEGQVNDLPAFQKVMWVVVLAALMLAAASLYMLGMRMLSESL